MFRKLLKTKLKYMKLIYDEEYTITSIINLLLKLTIDD